MANTYTQIRLQFIFASRFGASLIQSKREVYLYKYITGIVQNNKHKMLAINGVPDHVHMLIGMHPVQSISDLMQDVKGSSSTWINNNRFTCGRFEWQAGYGGFSYSKSQLSNVINYIMNQKEHHRGPDMSGLEEYHQLLEEFDMDYDERYIFRESE